MSMHLIFSGECLCMTSPTKWHKICTHTFGFRGCLATKNDEMLNSEILSEENVV